MTCGVCDASLDGRHRNTRYCSDKCKEKARPRRAYDAEATAQWRRNRLEQPGYRERINEQERRRAEVVRHWVRVYKISHGCVSCGYREHWSALDIDHMDGKTTEVSKLSSVRAILNEIERHKCVVRCANCHRIKTYENREWEK